MGRHRPLWVGRKAHVNTLNNMSFRAKHSGARNLLLVAALPHCVKSLWPGGHGEKSSRRAKMMPLSATEFYDPSEDGPVRQKADGPQVSIGGLHSDAHGQHGARPELKHPMGSGAKQRQVQGAASTDPHDHQVDMRFQRKLNDLLIGLADTHYGLNR